MVYATDSSLDATASSKQTSSETKSVVQFASRSSLHSDGVACEGWNDHTQTGWRTKGLVWGTLYRLPSFESVRRRKSCPSW